MKDQENLIQALLLADKMMQKLDQNGLMIADASVLPEQTRAPQVPRTTCADPMSNNKLMLRRLQIEYINIS